MTRMSIRYEHGLGADGGLVHIADAERGGRFTCAGCEHRLVAVKGAHRAHHFRHYEDVDCEPGRTIHNLAIRAILDGWRSARSEGRAYRLVIPCEMCGVGIDILDAAADFSDARAEVSVVSGTRSDVAFFGDAGETMVVEVVVTHSMEPETLAAYLDAGLDFHLIEIERDNEARVQNLRRGLLVDGDGRRCGDCTELANREMERQREMDERRQEHEARIERARTDGAALADAAFDRLRREPAAKGGIPKPIEYLRDGRISDRQRRFCAVAAKALMRMGFKQMNVEKPYLFERKILFGERSERSAWAELARTEVIEPRFYTAFAFEKCASGCSPSDYKCACCLPECWRCESKRAADERAAERLSACYDALMGRGGRR